jgi:2-polyprenyl-3-methyl-5-hydroxy-6-metoxy-1,4-benzoquinol methylase
MHQHSPERRQYMAANRRLWEGWTPHHVTSEFYDVEGFRAGRTTLGAVELHGVGDVHGKSLLHLQCHFGLDTLSWARQGAHVTGVDFSQPAIDAARALAAGLNLPATFVHSNIYDLPDHLQGEFDILFTSTGVLGWLPDIHGWAAVIAHFLKQGGIFFIHEVHPFALLFDEERCDGELRLRWPYFHQPDPLAFTNETSYAAPEVADKGDAFYWIHSLSDIVGALLRAGLMLESFEEHPFLTWAQFPWMVQQENGTWVLPSGSPEIPLMFSLRAAKP